LAFFSYVRYAWQSRFPVSFQSFIMPFFKLRLLIGLALNLLPLGAFQANPSVFIHQPELLSFDDLVTLAAVDPPPEPIAQKLDQLLSTPFISNEAAERHIQPKAPTMQELGPVLRVAEWNINRGEQEDGVRLALSDRAKFLELAHKSAVLDRKDLARVSNELQELQEADVVILDEVDHGVTRTKYRDVGRDLATALHMNYAYAVEFIELNSIYLGVKKKDAAELQTSQSGEAFGVDPKRYLGLEGSAVLSRYPIRSARIIRLPVLYDWYHQEIKAISDIERVRRWSAQKLFQEEIARQVRRGGRMALIVDLEIPQSPTGIVTVVCPHLEDYAGPKGRRRQMNYLLEQIREIPNPVILGGDLNTTGTSGRPLTIRRAFYRYFWNYRFWFRQIFFNLVPVPGLGYVFRAANYFKNLHDPTAFNVPILLPNPSRHFFRDVKSFRFADGSGFDFGENRKWSFRHRGSTLAESNQRSWKGFTTTFSFVRTYHGLVGKYKLDWFFVKTPHGSAAAGEIESSRLTPRFGRTLPYMNHAFGQRISDHCPITLSLPLGTLDHSRDR
jgi:endonuclease/exonuclease/phosphatase family metal-dependent hydrolase